MNKPVRPTHSRRQLHAAERTQSFLGQKGAPLINLFAGSSSPNYHQLRWRETDYDPDSLHTIKAAGDPNAHWLPRRWDRALVVASGRVALRAAAREDDNAHDAVGFVSEGVLHVGVLPEDVRFGMIWESGILSAAFRQGKQPIEATMGKMTETGFISSQELHVVDRLLPVKALPVIRPTTPLF